MSSNTTGPLAADSEFFKALIDADVATLEDLLAADFILVDVMGGSEVPKATLIGLVGSGQLKFESIEPGDAPMRIYGATGIVIGRTEMQLRSIRRRLPRRAVIRTFMSRSVGAGGWSRRRARRSPTRRLRREADPREELAKL